MGYFHREAYKACSRPRGSLAHSRVLTVPQIKFIPGLLAPKRRRPLRRRTIQPSTRFMLQGRPCRWAIHSFDDLVGASEQRRRDVEAERLGGSEVDHQFELGWLL